MTAWYCFRTRMNREVRTVHALRAAGFDVILLMRPEFKRAHTKHHHPSVLKREPLPALQPYIFIDMSAPDAWPRLAEEGLVKAVGIEGAPPQPLSRAGVKFIHQSHKALFQDRDWPRFSQLPPEPAWDVSRVEFSPGDVVSVRGGPFTGFEGRCVDIAGDAAKVLIPLFGRENVTRIPVASLKPATLTKKPAGGIQ